MRVKTFLLVMLALALIPAALADFEALTVSSCTAGSCSTTNYNSNTSSIGATVSKGGSDTLGFSNTASLGASDTIDGVSFYLRHDGVAGISGNTGVAFQSVGGGTSYCSTTTPNSASETYVTLTPTGCSWTKSRLDDLEVVLSNGDGGSPSSTDYEFAQVGITYTPAVTLDVNFTADWSGNERNLTTSTGSPVNRTHADGSSYLYFDGASDLVNASSGWPKLDSTTKWCIAANHQWNSSASSGHQNVVTYRFNFGSNLGIMYKVAGFASNVWQFLTGNIPASSSTAASNGAWTHVAWSYNGSHIFAWVNGVEEVNTSIAMKAEDASQVISIASEYGANYYGGGLDDLVFFNTSCSQEVVDSLYANETTALPSNLIMWYPFEDTPQTWGASADSCTYTSGDWNIDCTESCTIDTETDVGGNDIIFNGGGTVTVEAAISNYDDMTIVNACHVIVSGSAGGSIG